MAAVSAVRTVQVGEGALVVAATGDVDLLAAPELDDALRSALAREPGLIVVDLRAATMLDSRALGVLLACARRLSGAGGELVVVADDPRIVRIFEITGLDRTFRLERSLGEVLKGDGRALAG
jgi:anti-sigma B factor antagonist